MENTNRKVNLRRITLHGIKWEIVPSTKQTTEDAEVAYVFRNGRRVDKIVGAPDANDAAVMRMAQEDYEYAMACGGYIIVD